MLSTPLTPLIRGGRESIDFVSSPLRRGTRRVFCDWFPLIRCARRDEVPTTSAPHLSGGVMEKYFASALFLTNGTIGWCFATNSPYKKYFILIVWRYNNLKINQKLLVRIFSKNKTWIKKTKFYTYRSIIVNLDKNFREYGSEN